MLPLLFVIPVTIMPVDVPPAICATVKEPAGVSASAAVPTKLLELGGVPCCRVNADAGVNVGGVLDARLVKLKLTPAATPEAAAETVYGPPTVAFAVTVPVVAEPPV